MSDAGAPPKTDVTVVYVNVTRNLKPPKFTETNYEKTIKETETLGKSIIVVRAKDEDATVSAGRLSLKINSFFVCF